MKCERKLNQSLRFVWKKLREQYHTYAKIEGWKTDQEICAHPGAWCSPLSERMDEMRRHVTEAMITASSMRANVVFMTA